MSAVLASFRSQLKPVTSVAQFALNNITKSTFQGRQCIAQFHSSSALRAQNAASAPLQAALPFPEGHARRLLQACALATTAVGLYGFFFLSDTKTIQVNRLAPPQ